MKEMIYKNKSVAELLDNGTYKGYEYAIVSRGFHPCAYVKLPVGHKYYGLDYDDIPVDCHCGLSYSGNYVDGLPDCEGWWIGWDYGHCCDYSGFMMHEYWLDIDTSHKKKWTTSEILEEVKQVVEKLKELHEFVSEVMRVGEFDEKSARSAVYFAKSGSMHEREKPHNAENAEKSLREILGKMNGTL